MCVYMLMLGLEAGDLVQCLRTAAGTQMHVSRVSLDAAPLCHRESWHAHVLPRLYGFAEAVLRFRSCAALRYSYLLQPERRAELLRRECPLS